MLCVGVFFSEFPHVQLHQAKKYIFFQIYKTGVGFSKNGARNSLHWECGLVCCVKWHLVSVRTFSVMYDHTFSRLANHQIRIQAVNKVGCQPGDCIWSLQSSSGVCVGMYGLTYFITFEGLSDQNWSWIQQNFSKKQSPLRMWLEFSAVILCYFLGIISHFSSFLEPRMYYGYYSH